MHKGDYYGPHLVNLRSKIVILIIAFIGYSYWKYNAYAYSIGQPGSFATAFMCGFKICNGAVRCRVQKYIEKSSLKS